MERQPERMVFNGHCRRRRGSDGVASSRGDGDCEGFIGLDCQVSAEGDSDISLGGPGRDRHGCRGGDVVRAAFAAVPGGLRRGACRISQPDDDVRAVGRAERYCRTCR